MKIAVENKKANPVLRRDEILVSIDYQGGPTPSIASLRTELAKVLGVTEDRIEIAKLLSATGRPAGTAWVRVWETAELVPKPKVKKKAEEKK
ncbi:MAG: hypothetical protein QW751_01125 [Candidatus Aenigmatarchaeota archaeon]|nr:hypothetical protein [Candidatus Aenigmarchaeota archaeon]